MAKLPYMPFYPSDYLRDTRCLSLAARGVWIDLICALWNAPTRGKKTLTMEGWAGEIGKGVEEIRPIISELETQHIFSSSRKPNGGITITSRRMVREEKARESNRKRQREFYERHTKQKTNAITNTDITGIYQKSEVRSQKSEEELRKEGGRGECEGIRVSTKRAPAPRGCVYPDEFAPDARAEEMALSYGLNVHKLHAAFKDHHLAKGTIFKDWQSAFRNWIRNEVKFSQRGSHAL